MNKQKKNKKTAVSHGDYAPGVLAHPTKIRTAARASGVAVDFSLWLWLVTPLFFCPPQEQTHPFPRLYGTIQSNTPATAAAM